MNTHYRDDYATCEKTNAELRVYSPALPADAMTGLLHLEPTSTQPRRERETRGDQVVRGRDHGWFLNSEGHVDSRDVRRHVDWLLDRIVPVAEQLRELLRMDPHAKAAVCCLWVSASGHGGPVLSGPQLTRLAELGLDIWFDVYFSNDE